MTSVGESLQGGSLWLEEEPGEGIKPKGISGNVQNAHGGKVGHIQQLVGGLLMMTGKSGGH